MHGHGDISGKLKLALVINISILGVDLLGYFISGSLALLGDAGHVATDVLALGTAMIAINLATAEFHEEATFGHHRAEVLAAIFNSIMLLAVCVYIFFRAYQRFIDPVEVKTTEMLVAAVIALIGNSAAAYILHGHSDINVRGAYLHLLYDALSSFGVVVGAVLIIFTGYHVIDSVISVMIAVLVLSSSFRLLREGIGIVMQWTPEGLDVNDIVERLKEVEGVCDVHDVHLWTLCSSIYSFSAHIVVEEENMVVVEQIKKDVRDVLHNEFNIRHTTLETECTECGDQRIQTVCHG